MLRKILAGAAAAAALLATGSATADEYDPNDPCFLSGGCFWDELAGRWICPAYVYAQCAPG